MAKLSESRKSLAQYVINPAVDLLARTAVTPDLLTWLGFIITLVATWLIASGHLFAGGWMVILAGIFDIMDGALARRKNLDSRAGALLDSTLDRLSEAALLFGILLFNLLNQRPMIEALLVFVAFVGSILVSYVRARAEGLGLECQVGIFTRPERVVILALGLLLGQFRYALTITLGIITLFSFISAGQRLVHGLRQARSNVMSGK